MVDGSLFLDDSAAFRLGLTLAILSAIGLSAIRGRVGAGLLERARQDGYDDGYADGCEVYRPARLVAIGASSDSARPGGGAPQQLGQQLHVRSGADRVG
jgi:hypothetical protein